MVGGKMGVLFFLAFLAFSAGTPLFHDESQLVTKLEQEVEGRNLKVNAECELCKVFVGEIEKKLDDPGTMAQLNQTLWGYCLQVTNSSTLCGLVIPQALSEIEKALSTSPQAACTGLGMCPSDQGLSSQRNQLVPKFKELMQKKKRPDSKGCVICQTVLGLVGMMSQNPIVMSVLNTTLWNVCEGATQNSDSCRIFVPVVMNVLQSVLSTNPKVACTDIGFCVRGPRKTFQGEKIQEGDSECELCKIVVNGLEDILDSNEVMGKINTTLWNACMELTQSSQECGTLVPVAENFIKSVLSTDPSEVCTEIGMCSGGQRLFGTLKKKTSIGKVKNGAGCEECKLAVTAVEQLLNSPEVIQKVNSTLWNECMNILQSTQTCGTFVPLIINELKSLLSSDPQTVCSELGLCTSGQSTFFRQKIGKESGIENGDGCEECKLAVTAVEQLMNSPEVIQKVNSTLWNECMNILQSTQTCGTFVPLIINELKSLLSSDPQTVCSELGLCTSAHEQQWIKLRTVRSLRVEANSVECDICKFVMQKIDDYLMAHMNDTEKIINDVCKRLPPPTSTECLKTLDPLFEEYYPLLVLIVLSPENACTYLKMCPKTAETIFHQFN
ncbi:prosaposin isoform X4 [Lingula anatina]|uniref:Prosaposin isoform X4 n=1 Tax=Lingula anatina TaxID=7574 RepID=A0A1S3I2U9_LINAN|nr:prosaposin isoform X4 [Lingula anatina]|eukprot:XP_013392156.2 prosaposin isoform X4 [Lingula anatina]